MDPGSLRKKQQHRTNREIATALVKKIKINNATEGN